MKRFSKSTQGVTLLEIMLVLAIAAMIIVMSVKYYQSATASQQANVLLEEIQAITAAADGLGQAGGSYSVITSIKIQNLMPGNTLKTPWGSTISIATPAPGATTYTVTIPAVPYTICPLINARLSALNHISAVTACTASGTTELSYTYSMN